MNAQEIARRTGHSRNTVERHLKDKGSPAYSARPAVAGKLDALKSFVSERVAAAQPERPSATVLLGELRDRGYTGGIIILLAHPVVSQPLGVARSDDTVRDEAGSPDAGRLAGDPAWSDPLSVFVPVLGHSRMTYARSSPTSGSGRCRRAMRWRSRSSAACRTRWSTTTCALGDRPRPVWPGAAPAAVGVPRLCSPPPLPAAAVPYRARTKGEVEPCIHYLRDSFWVPLDSWLRPLGLKVDAATANVEVRKWLRDTANPCVHGTTGRVPTELFVKEQEAFLPLAG